jgi:hypothetical protein
MLAGTTLQRGTIRIELTGNLRRKAHLFVTADTHPDAHAHAAYTANLFAGQSIGTDQPNGIVLGNGHRAVHLVGIRWQSR